MYGDPSSDLTVTVTDLNNPTAGTLTPSYKSVTVNWTKGTSGVAKDTLVLRSTSSTKPTPAGGTAYNTGDTVTLGGQSFKVVHRGNATSATDSGLEPGTTYYYYFYAENNSYYSAGVDKSTTTLTPGVQVVDWKDDSGASNGDWVQAGKNLWYYQTAALDWPNVTDFGAQHVRINNTFKAANHKVTVNTTVASLTFGASATTAATVAGASGVKLTVNGGITNLASTAHTISAPVVLGANTEVDLTGGLTVSGVISGSSKSLTKKGSGTLVLSGANTYDGGTTVSAGTLQIGAGSTAGVVAGNIANNATVVFNRSNDLTYSGNITGTGSVTKQGAGTLTLSGTSTYSGGTTISAGTLKLNKYNAISGNIVNNSALIFNPSANGTFSGTISGSGTLEKTYTSRTLTLTGANSYSGTTTITAGTLEIGNGGTSGVLPGNAVNNGALIFNRSDAVTYGYVISGTGTLEKKGTGTLTMSGTSTHSGNTTVSAGTLVLSGGMASSAVSVSSGATLAASGENKRVKSLSVSSGGALAVKPGANTFAAQSGAVSLANGSIVKFDTTGLDVATGPWTIATGTSSATCGTVTLQNASGTPLSSDWSVEASGNNIVVKYAQVQTVTAAATLTLYAGGEDGDLEADTDGDGTLSYSGYSSSIVTVDSEGKVTPVGYGTTTITITAAATATYAEGTAECEVTVRAAKPSGSGSITAHGAGTEVGSFTVSYTKGDGAYAVLLAKEGADPTAPTDGQGADRVATGGKTWAQAVAYPAGNSDGTKAIVHSTTSPGSQTITGATPGAAYHLALYSRDPDTYASADRKYFSYSETPDTATVYTKSTEPTGAPSITDPAADNDVTDGSTSTTIELSKGTFTGASGETSVAGTLLILVQGNSASGVTAPTDGTAYTEGTTALGGTIVYMGTGTEAPIRNLTQNTTYTLVAYSYAMVAGASDTVNYYTTSRAVRVFKTKESTAPSRVWATGVDGDQFLLNWSPVANAPTYDLEVYSAATTVSDNLTGWTSEGSGTVQKTGTKTYTLTYSGVSYTWTTLNTGSGSTAYRAYVYNGGTYGNEIRFDAIHSAFRSPVIYGKITSVSYGVRAGGGTPYSDRQLTLKASYDGGTTWTTLQVAEPTSNSSDKSFTYSTELDGGANGVMLMWEKDSTGGKTTCLGSFSFTFIPHEKGVPGYSSSRTGLTDGTTYSASVSVAGANDWSDPISVKAGVVPDDVEEVTASRTSSSTTFEWTGLGNPAGYRVQATTHAAPALGTKTCPAQSLGLNTFSGSQEWRYTGTAITANNDNTPSTPMWRNSYGHLLIGAGQALESTNFPIAGLTSVQLSVDLKGHNATTLEDGRVNAYYRIDDGPWCFLGTGTESAVNSSKTTLNFTVPQGALEEGNTISFKLVEPNSKKTSNYFVCTGLSGITVTGLAKGSGDYSGTDSSGSWVGYKIVDTTTEGTSYKVEGLSPNQRVYFRVQALQGGTLANPVGRSVWVEASGQAGAFAGPALLAADPVERHAFTANWTADAAATGGYQIEWTRCGGSGAGDTTVSTCANGTLTVGGETGWRYIRPAGSYYPQWKKGSANTTVGHNMIVGVSPANPSPAVASPEMDLSGFSGAYVEFSHWSRHATLYAPDAKVTLWYRTSTDGSSWGAWVRVGDTANLANGATIVTEQMALPPEAVGAGKEHVQIKLSTEYSLPGNGGHANIIPAEEGDSTYTGPLVKDITVHGTGSGTPDYSDSCAQGHSGIIDVPAGTTLKEFTGLAAGTPYYYHVRSVVSGSPNPSDWSEGRVTTLAPMAPPEEVWAEDIRQKHMTLAWTEAPGADENTRYKYEVSSCSPSATPTVVAVSESPTNAELSVDAEWTYIGGGTLVGEETVTVGESTLSKASEAAYVESTKESYPVWAGNANSHPEHSLVLAGLNSPGLESTEFSTVGATEGSLSFGHGRWYAQESGSGAATVLTLYYSIDGGDSWTQFATTANVYNKSYAYNNVVTHNLPDAAMGHAHVKVRLVAEAATVGKATTSATTYHALGAAVTAAKVTLTKPTGDYGSGCIVASSPAAGLTYDQLMAELSGLAAGATYYFRVAASDGELVNGSLQYGAWVESMAKTLAAPGAPASAWVVPESIGRHAMTVQWEAVAEAETYEVKVYQGSNASGTLKQTLETDATTLTVTGLDAQTQYYFTVRSKADGEQSSGTANCTGTTSASLAVTGFCVTNILDTSLTVKWDAVAATTYTLEVGPMTAAGETGALYETIECPATTLARSDAGNGWFYLGGNANYPKYYVKSGGTAAQKAEDQGHVLSYNSAGTPGIQSRWFSTFGAKSATVEFLHGRWFNGGNNSALQVFYSIDGGTTWASAGDIPAVPDNSVPGGTAGGEKTVTRLALPARALGQRTVAIRVMAPQATSGGSYGYGAEIKDLTVRLEAYPQSASTFSGAVSGGSKALTGLTAGTRYWFRLTATESGVAESATAIQTAATRTRTKGVVLSQGFEGPSADGALDTTLKEWGYEIKYIPVQNGSASAHTVRVAGDPEVVVVDGENPLYGDKALRMSGSAAAGVYGVVEFLDKNFGSAQNVAVTIPFAARDLASGENLWVSYSTDNGATWVAPDGLATLAKSGMTLGKIARGGSDAINQNWPYNHGVNETTRPAGDAYTFEVRGATRLAVRVAFCGNSGGAKHYFYLDEVKLERLATPPSAVSATANAQGSVNLGWTPAGGQSVVIIRGQDMRNPPASVDLGSLPHGYEVVTNATGGLYWVNTADPGVATTGVDGDVTGGWKYFYYFYGALDNGDGTYTLSKECVSAEAIVKGMVEAIASQGWDGWDVHPWGYKKGRTTNPGQAGDCGYWAYNQSGETLPYKWAHFVEGSWEYDGDGRGAQGARTYANIYGAGKTYGPAGRTDPDSTAQLGVSSYTNYFGTNCFRLSGGSGWKWTGTHTYTNNNGNERTVTDPWINTNNAAIQFDTIDLSGYKNVEFSFHYAQTYSGGGNYMHVAISTNGNGENGSWMAYDNKNDGGWRQVESSRDYGLQLQTMTSEQTGGNVDFYDESRAPYGNPFVLSVPDSVTQMTVRLTFFDTTGHDQRAALVFVDEVRLTGEVAIEAPKPYIADIGKEQFMVHWAPVTDATTYDVQVTEICDETKIKLAEAFPVNALPKGWTKSDSGVNFPKTASRLYSEATGEHDHGLSLTGQGGWLTSPEVGGTTNLHFWAKAIGGGNTSKLIVQAKGAEDREWETLLTKTSAELTTTWTEYELALPNRQWTQVRFMRSADGTGDIYVDDVELRGVGVYTGAVVFDASGVSATNQLVTGLTSGKRYLAHVRAAGAPAGVVVRSAWGETADWTAGDFAVAADGFEMTRSTWGNPGSGIVVMAVNQGHDYSEAGAPTGTPEAGDVFGQGVVIARSTTAQAAPGLEHVVPYGTRTEDYEAKYVVYWKHGSYWEGRLETNVVLGTYVCAAADAIAVTNATTGANLNTYSSAEGKGWNGGWVPWDGAASYISVAQGSLIGSDKLHGAGGNMLCMNISEDNKLVRAYRELAAKRTSDDGETWMMVTIRSQYGTSGESANSKMFGIQLTGAASNPGENIWASVGKLWGNSTDPSYQFLQIDSSTDSANGHRPGGESDYRTIATGTRLYDSNASGKDGIYTYVLKYNHNTGLMQVKVYAVADVRTIANNGALAPNSTPPASFDASWTFSNKPDLAGVILLGYGWNGTLDFDEVRIGDSWQDIVGKETEAPFPVTSAEAWTDGNELVRISWTYAADGHDSTANVDRPLADGVRIFAREGTTGAWTEIYKGKGTNTADVAAGKVSRWDHVVAPGSVHQYQVVAYASGKSATAVDAVLKGSSPATHDIATGEYGETEYLDTISYTNSTAFAANTWKGGHGFGDTPSAWIKGDDNGSWSAVNPEEAYETVHITAAHSGAKAVAGNVLKVTGLGDGKTSTIYRQLAGDPWCAGSGDTFYAAFRMGYQKIGNTRAGLVLTDSGGNHVWVGKARGADGDYRKRMGIEVSGGSGAGWAEGKTLEPYSNVNSQGGTAANAYLIVVKMQRRSENGRADISAWQFKIGVDDLPAKEPYSHANYGNAAMANVAKLEFTAGGESGVSIGEAFFDDLRFGTSWEDIIGATEPEDAWTLGGAKTTGYYLGDTVRWTFGSTPKGAKQHAWVSLSTSASFPAGASTKTAETSWLRNEPNAETGPNTIWQGDGLLLWQAGSMYAGGSVKGELVTKNSWERTAADGGGKYKYDTYTVTPLPAPTSQRATGGTAKVTLGWTKATGALPDGAAGTRTFDEVMVVRFASAEAQAAWTPAQGETYMKGQSYTRNGVSGTIAYRGTEPGFEDKGLTKNTTYYYAFFTVNNSYYSTAVYADALTDENDPPVVVDGNTDDWVGLPSEVKNSSTMSSGEYIWTDKVEDARHDTAAAFDSDLKEFRVKVSADGKYVYFLARLNCMTNAANPYISVAMVTNGVVATQLATEGNDPGENWIGDESDTFMGDGLFEPASLHYADVQMAVHKVQQGGTWTWQLEVYTKDDTRWHEPESKDWSVQGSDGPNGAGASDPCVEWKVRREDLGIGVPSGGGQLPVRFTVATFANGGGWNNDTVATAEVGAGKTHAVDTLCIAPWNQNDKDLALTAWDEGLREKVADYWVDLWFGHGAIHNAKPNAPAMLSPANESMASASPMMTWAAATDGTDGTSGTTGFVVGYLLEVSTNNLFNGLEGTAENGPVSLRVNLEGAGTTSYRFQTDSREYWWRVRARDNSGALSDPTPWHYTVQGKTDNEGPVAKLLYVGPRVMDFINNTVDAQNPDGYRTEQELSGDATSVLDSELEDGGHDFGFVIEWYDVNGVYATNHMRGGDGSPGEGHFAYNILAEHGDGTVYGRVSPNWDLVIVERTVTSETWTKQTSGNPSTDKYYEKTISTRYVPTEDTTPGAGKHYYTMKGGSYRDVGDTTGKNPYELGWSEARESATYKRSSDTRCESGKEYYTRASKEPYDEQVSGEDHFYQWEENYTLPKEDGTFEIVNRWLIDCGKDAVFTNGAANVTETINDGNSGKYLTNFVRNAFSIGNYRPTLDIYLTLSAEDGCTRGEFREMEWYTPPIKGYDAEGKNGNNGSWAPGPIPSDGKTSSGWCSDYPNPARNVTVNQLIKIPVRDNDTTPPVTSMAKWRLDALDEAGGKMYPMVAVATGTGSGSNSDSAEDSRSGAWDPSWANLDAGGLTRLPTYEGQGKSLQWHLTDGDVAEGGTWKGKSDGSGLKLNLFFNVYDEYVHGGLKYGTTESNMVPKTLGTGATVTRGLFNTGFLLKDWVNDAWAAGTNWAKFNREMSSIIRQGATTSSVNTEHMKGSDPTTVLAWTLDATEANVEALLEQQSPLSAIGTDPVTGDAKVVSNALKLYAFDADNNAWGDQASAELEFGQLIFTDDDATAPEIPGFEVKGTGTNWVDFGPVGKWTWSSASAAFTPLVSGVNQPTAVSGHKVNMAGGESAAAIQYNAGDGVAQFSSAMHGSDYTAGSKYFEFTLGGASDAMHWLVEGATFKNRVTAKGPTRYVLTVEGSVNRDICQPDGSSWTLNLNGTVTKPAAGTTINFYAKNAAATLTSAGRPVTRAISQATLSYSMQTSGGLGAQTAKVQYSFDGSTWKTWKTHTGTDFAENQKAEDFAIDLLTKTNEEDGGKALPNAGTLYVRFLGGGGMNGNVGFKISDLQLELVTGAAEALETKVAEGSMDKVLTDSGDDYASETVNEVSLVFSTPVENIGSETKTFRLYGYRATASIAEEEAGTTFSGDGNWGINDFELHGIVTSPKSVAVTDSDVKYGTWTNVMEAMDGEVAGYDTTRSGLWLISDANGDNRPTATITYPAAAVDPDTGAAMSGNYWEGGKYTVSEYAPAQLTAGANADFASVAEGVPTGWTLTGSAAVAAKPSGGGEMLSLPGQPEEGTATQDGAWQVVTVSAPAGKTLESVAVTVTVRARALLAKTEDGADNHFDVTVEFLNSSDGRLAIHTETLEADTVRNWKNYAIPPQTLANGTVAKVKVTVQEHAATGTGLQIDSIDISTFGYAPMVAGAPAANDLLAAQLRLKTPASTSANKLAISQYGAGHTMPENQKYTLTVNLSDYDHDRDGDMETAHASAKFWLDDDDIQPPVQGASFGGPFGVRVGGEMMSTRFRQWATTLETKTNYVWFLSDHSLAESAGASSGANLDFMVDYYDFSGWNVTDAKFTELTPSGAASTVHNLKTAGTVQSGYTEIGAGTPNAPSATLGWRQTVKAFYTDHKTQFESDGIVTNAFDVKVVDMDDDRPKDALPLSPAWTGLGYIQVMDQDISAPVFRKVSTENLQFRGTLIATNVPDGASLAAQAYNETVEPYALGGWSAHQGTIPEGGASVDSGRSHLIYDSQMIASTADGNHFVVQADIVDKNDTARGRQVTGVKRGATEKTTASSVLSEGASFDMYNTYLEFTSGSGAGAKSYNARSFYKDKDSGWSTSDGSTKMLANPTRTSWVWGSADIDDALATLLPSGENTRTWALNIHAYDADADRANDQKSAVLAGPTLRVRDDDTNPPGQPGEVTLTGLTVPSETLTRLNAPWTNDLSKVKMSFGKATDAKGTATDANGDADLNASGIAKYRLAAPGTAIGADKGDEVFTVADPEAEADTHSGIPVPQLTAAQQGFGEYQLFAVDADADRDGDALAGSARGVPLAYDITKPTGVKFGTKSDGSDAHSAGVDTDNVDDPTTQFKLTWYASDVGPDDPVGDKTNYDAIPEATRTAAAATPRDVLSPWETYKVYYKEYDHQYVMDHKGPSQSSEDYIWANYLGSGTPDFSGEEWASVTKDTEIADPTAGGTTEAPAKYTTLGTVAADGTGVQTATLYDLDFDREYIVVIRGVDKAGNEGPVTMNSWATNNTIKFAVTQGVVRASAKINDLFGSATDAKLAEIGMQRIATGEGAPKQGAVLYWMAAGQHEDPTTHERTGAVTKEYDLIWRDAASFTENGGERDWTLASSGEGKNSGTSQTNWNYQASDFGGLGRNGAGNRMRFFRASYKGRWNPSGDALPLASEEVYAMNRVPLVEGRNLVALQGVPYTNTFAGVFGTDTSIFPAGGSLATATRVEFCGTPNGMTIDPTEAYYFLDDNGVGQWWSVQAPSYTVVTAADASPRAEGWYEASGGEYELSGDPAIVSGKTYYVPRGTEYIEVDAGTVANPYREGWYVNTAATGTPVYTPSTDTAMASGVAYYKRNDRNKNENVTDTVQAANFFSRGFEIVIPDLSDDRFAGFRARQTTNGVYDPTRGRNWQYGFDWYPILKVPTTNAVATRDADAKMFKVTVNGGKSTDWRYTLAALNLPVAAHPSEMNLVQTNADGTWKSGFHPGDGMMTGDLIYIWDNVRATPLDNTVVYLDGETGKWMKRIGNIQAPQELPVGEKFFKPNDVIVIVAHGDKDRGETTAWEWKYDPKDFYKLPNRWMGRKQENP